MNQGNINFRNSSEIIIIIIIFHDVSFKPVLWIIFSQGEGDSLLSFSNKHIVMNCSVNSDKCDRKFECAK